MEEWVGGCEVAYYIFYISAVDVGKWLLFRFNGNLSGIQQTGIIMVTADIVDTLCNLQLQIGLSGIQKSLFVPVVM
jgi:hypothetical protein